MAQGVGMSNTHNSELHLTVTERKESAFEIVIISVEICTPI